MWRMWWTCKRGIVRATTVMAASAEQASKLVFLLYPAVSISLPKRVALS